jgi:hypothetical protein
VKEFQGVEAWLLADLGKQKALTRVSAFCYISLKFVAEASD